MQEINNIRLAIKNNNTNELMEILKNEFIIEDLISEDDFGSICFIYKHALSNKLLKNSFDFVVNFCGNNHINNTSIEILKFIISYSGLNELELDLLDEEIYHICKYDGNIELIKLLSESEINVDWEAFMIRSCHFSQYKIFSFLVDKYKFSIDIINQSLSSVINTTCFDSCSDNPEQMAIIQQLIQCMSADVNQEGEEWNYLYLDCFQNVPYAAKYFYTKDFNPSCIDFEEFWIKIIGYMLSKEYKKKHYINALIDIKHCKINIDKLINTFNDLKQSELVNLLSDEPSR